jgi:hypothetical protein
MFGLYLMSVVIICVPNPGGGGGCAGSVINGPNYLLLGTYSSKEACVAAQTSMGSDVPWKGVLNSDTPAFQSDIKVGTYCLPAGERK